MRKITWDHISIELTRKCQLKCRHCYRGKSENREIGIETLDKFLENTEIIGMLHFTGGEPLLALDQMEFVADKLNEYRIPLFKMQVIANGYERSDRFFEIIKKFNEIIHICHKYGRNNGQDVPNIASYIVICVSCDRYHTEQGYDPNDTVKFYKNKLKGYAKVTQYTEGDMPYAKGNGKNLAESVNIVMPSDKIKRQIEYLTRDHKPMCPYGRTYNLVHENQIYCVCEMYMDIFGNITAYEKSNQEFKQNDESDFICNVNVTTDILNDIEKYNAGKLSCLDKMKIIAKEQREPKNKIKMWKEMLRSDMALKQQGYEGSNAYDRMVDLLADKHVFDPDEYKDRDASKYLSAAPMDIQMLTDEKIEKYKKEIMNDDEVYAYGK